MNRELLLIALVMEFLGRLPTIIDGMIRAGIDDPTKLDYDALLARPRAEIEAEVDATAPPEPPVA